MAPAGARSACGQRRLAAEPAQLRGQPRGGGKPRPAGVWKRTGRAAGRRWGEPRRLRQLWPGQHGVKRGQLLAIGLAASTVKCSSSLPGASALLQTANCAPRFASS